MLQANERYLHLWNDLFCVDLQWTPYSTSTLHIESRYIHWQGLGQEQHQSEHWSEHRRCWQVVQVMRSRSQLRGSDVTQHENSILMEDRKPQPSRDQVTASDGLAMPGQSNIQTKYRHQNSDRCSWNDYFLQCFDNVSCVTGSYLTGKNLCQLPQQFSSVTGREIKPRRRPAETELTILNN